MRQISHKNYKLHLLCFLISAALALPLVAANEKPSLYFTISLIWTGSHLHSHNIEALQDLRKKHPKIRFHHLVSPAYFVSQNAKKNRDIIMSLIQRDDQVGIYIAPWRSIVEKSKTLFRVSPSFWGPKEDGCHTDCGNSVPLTIYQEDDIKRIFKTSLDILKTSGLPVGQSYAVSGWQHSADIVSAAATLGLKFDFSPIPPSRIERRLHHFPIFSWTFENWQQFEKFPYPMQSPTDSHVIFIPQNGGVVDYNTSNELVSYFQETINTKLEAKSLYNLVIHQETAATFLPRLHATLQALKDLAEKNAITLTFDWLSYRNRIESH
ncbi:hypothetical protein [Pseudobacteriovorax antillogorgiicola]|uniref:Polysaccharide deacetylase n=1 Tax=Pseudobacteriovorax antillogorgiicola TaxID=1513793 RepID=A0A1Y6CGZ7_9BACT|nr:hypothetical protein [Pseudobacteriovorax antillogorgiicola]TCS48682.1 hypothetical protein EDD56_117104 [Pseudobacteriovorax antillogorgiicola]SMF54877.1 hypothetical protein SAMN06296036_11755 [Pseudobacteriovorax antillogorgiicola]